MLFVELTLLCRAGCSDVNCDVLIAPQALYLSGESAYDWLTYSCLCIVNWERESILTSKLRFSPLSCTFHCVLCFSHLSVKCLT